MTAESPKLTVAMPVRNQTRYVGRAIASILNQSFKDFEFLIMDDGSTDGTPELLRTYARRDPRVRLLLGPNVGLPATRNALLAEAKTDVVAWIDSDDIAVPERLQRQWDAMQRDASLWVLGTRIAIIDEYDRELKVGRVVVGPDKVAQGMLKGCKIVQSSCMMRRDRILRIGGYRAAFAYSQDYDLFLRASEKGKIDNIDFLGLKYRSHGTNVTSRHGIYQSALADLARASHERRKAGLSDPTDELAAPPPIDHPIFDAMIGPVIHTYRLIDAVRRCEPSRETLKALIFAPIQRKQRKDYQRGVVELVRSRRIGFLALAACARAVAMGPRRFVTELLK